MAPQKNTFDASIFWPAGRAARGQKRSATRASISSKTRIHGGFPRNSLCIRLPGVYIDYRLFGTAACTAVRVDEEVHSAVFLSQARWVSRHRVSPGAHQTPQRLPTSPYGRPLAAVISVAAPSGKGTRLFLPCGGPGKGGRIFSEGHGFRGWPTMRAANNRNTGLISLKHNARTLVTRRDQVPKGDV